MGNGEGRKPYQLVTDFFLVQQNFYKTIPSLWRNHCLLVQVSTCWGSLVGAQLYHLSGKRRGDADLKLGATLSRKPFCPLGEAHGAEFPGLLLLLS